MNCSCRMAALRIFVRSVVRVHTPPPTPATRGTRSCQTLSQSIRYGRHDGLRPLPFSASTRRGMSSAQATLDDPMPEKETADDGSSTTRDENHPDDKVLAPRFPKALKAKKKQKRLVDRVAEDLMEAEKLAKDIEAALDPDMVEQEVLEKGVEEEEAEAKQEAEGPASAQEEEPTSLVEKIPKNRRKREARKAGTYVPGESPPQNTEKPAEEKPTEGKRPPREQKKPQDKERRAHDPEKQKRPKREAREVQEQDNTAEPPPKKEPWQLQKAALKEKFPEGWSPRKRLSPDALAGIKALHQQFPEEYTTDVLANKFEVSPEAIRRILKSKWEPAPDEEIERQERWFSRGKRIWSAWADEGKKPPTKWRKEGITRDPSYHERRQRSLAHKKLAKTLM